jgi:hypothetical protein
MPARLVDVLGDGKRSYIPIRYGDDGDTSSETKEGLDQVVREPAYILGNGRAGRRALGSDR